MIKLDTQREGRSALWKTYQQMTLDFLKKSDKPVGSRECFEYVGKLGIGISRASMINFLNGLVDEGIVNYEEESGKGGYHRLYSLKYDAKATDILIANKIISSLQGALETDLKIVLEI